MARTPAQIQADIDSLTAALASGVMRASYNGKSTEFRSYEEMDAIIARLEGELLKASGLRRRRTFFAISSGDKGL
jgi:hypothetical protein